MLRLLSNNYSNGTMEPKAAPVAKRRSKSTRPSSQLVFNDLENANDPEYVLKIRRTLTAAARVNRGQPRMVKTDVVTASLSDEKDTDQLTRNVDIQFLN